MSIYENNRDYFTRPMTVGNRLYRTFKGSVLLYIIPDKDHEIYQIYPLTYDRTWTDVGSIQDVGPNHPNKSLNPTEFKEYLDDLMYECNQDQLYLTLIMYNYNKDIVINHLSNLTLKTYWNKPHTTIFSINGREDITKLSVQTTLQVIEFRRFYDTSLEDLKGWLDKDKGDGGGDLYKEYTDSIGLNTMISCFSPLLSKSRSLDVLERKDLENKPNTDLMQIPSYAEDYLIIQASNELKQKDLENNPKRKHITLNPPISMSHLSIDWWFLGFNNHDSNPIYLNGNLYNTYLSEDNEEDKDIIKRQRDSFIGGRNEIYKFPDDDAKDEKTKTKTYHYMDVNNLYGYTMANQPLPYKHIYTRDLSNKEEPMDKVVELTNKIYEDVYSKGDKVYYCAKVHINYDNIHSWDNIEDYSKLLMFTGVKDKDNYNKLLEFVKHHPFVPVRITDTELGHSYEGVDDDVDDGYEDGFLHVGLNPDRERERILYPIGQFTTVLGGKELEYALLLGIVEDIEWYDIYKCDYILKSYVEYIQSLREVSYYWKKTGKALINLLFGKFAQMNYIRGDDETLPVLTPGVNSIPIISSAISSHSRFYMYQVFWMLYRAKAQVYYMDTDAFIVDNKGKLILERLNLTSPTQVGKFKDDCSSGTLHLYNLKRYIFKNTDKGLDTIKMRGIKGGGSVLTEYNHESYTYLDVTGVEVTKHRQPFNRTMAEDGFSTLPVRLG